MAKENSKKKKNETSSSNTKKSPAPATAPSPSEEPPANYPDAEPPKTSSSKASVSSDSDSPSPTESPSQSPPHAPPQASPPPPQSLPPPPSTPPAKGSPPPPSSSSPPPTPPSSPPPSSPPPTSSSSSLPSTSSSPPPSPTGHSPSPPSQSKTPSPQGNSAPSFTPPSPSNATPPRTPAGQNNPQPSSSQSPHSKSNDSSSKSHSHSQSQSQSPSPSPHNKTEAAQAAQYILVALAAVFIVAFVAFILFWVLRRKNRRTNHAYGMPPPKKSQMKGDVHYYVDEPGYANGPQEGYYNSQHTGGMHHMRAPSDATQQINAGQILFSYDTIVEITSAFSRENVIGEGGFGCVYKASMPDGRVGAVKMLKAGSGQGEREFKAEVETISRIHHRHLVSLIGYCVSEQQRVLIYEYVPNGNLNQHLHGSEWSVLDWSKRMKIAIGSARGLAYLHEGCNPKIIHRDIKSANILLDDAYEAQVADFGLARLTDDANTHVSTRVMGTFGYMAPEYATSGKLTDRSDVFSFGVVLLELVTGRKPVDPSQPVGDESLVEWARPLLLRAIDTGDFGDLADPRLERQYVDSEMFIMIEAAAACVRHSAPKRPSMVQVARALDCGDQVQDLSNGVKYGQSTIYDSGQYNEDIMRFRRMGNGSFDDEYDMYSAEYNSREMSGSNSAWLPQNSSGDSETKAIHGPMRFSEQRS